MNELKCPDCYSTDFYGPSVFDERLVTSLHLGSDIPSETHRLIYKSRVMCKNCGHTIETTNEATLNLHKLAQLLEYEND